MASDSKVDATIARFNKIIAAKFTTTDVEMSGDDSGSMAPGRGYSSTPADPRFAREGTWGEQTWLMDQVGHRATAVDKDGVDINFINSAKSFTLHEGESVAELLRRHGIEPTYTTAIWTRLENSFKGWLTAKDGNSATKDRVHLFFTDGAPGDGSDGPSPTESQYLVFKTIAWICAELKARKLSKTNYSINFIQAGRDGGATAFLQACDDEIGDYIRSHAADVARFIQEKGSDAAKGLIADHGGDVFAALDGMDIVDTVKYTAGASAAKLEFEILKMLAGSKLADFDGGALEKIAASLGVRA